MQCVKCSNPGTISLRKKDYYCDTCFLTNTNHKFRASLGKNKILSKNEKVLLCLSGEAGSTVLLNLVDSGMAMDSHKKLRVTPYCLHIIDNDTDGMTEAEYVLQQCAQYNFSVYFVHIAQYMKNDLELSAPDSIPKLETAIMDQYKTIFNGLPMSARNDLTPKIKRNLFIKCAQKLHCKFIFNAETTSTLAVNLLSNISLGRGSQVENDVGFCDNRSNIKILRPMKDITQEELMIFSQIKNLKPFCIIHAHENSLQSVIASFVEDLQQNFPATISTVCKTADKIGVDRSPQTQLKCTICESAIEIGKSNLTAFEATKFSRTVSERNHHTMTEESVNINHDRKGPQDENINNSLFPHIYEKLCYSCSRNYSLNHKNMPKHIQTLINL